MEGPSSSPGSGSAPASGLWELSDRGAAPVQLATPQVLEALLSRRLSLYASVRPAGAPAFAAPDAFPDLAPAAPAVAFARAGSFPDQVSGYVAVSPRPEILLQAARGIRADPAFPKLGFFLPALTREPGFTMIRPTKLFQLWPGAYVTAIFPSRILKPGAPLVLYVFVLNLSQARATHAVNLASLSLPQDQEAALSFDLEPYRWDVHRIAFVPPFKPGDHKIDFRSTTTGAKVAKSAAVAVATLGTVIYSPGHKGFGSTVKVLEPAATEMLGRWEDYAAKQMAAQFDASRADRLVAPSGAAFGKDDVLAWYRAYLAASPEVVSRLAQVGGANNPAALDQAVRELAQGFLAREYPAGARMVAAGSV